ncbi:dihydroxyacetone kinase subunit DhaK [Tessaracoccus sp. SD287]|uniref:dihydroxyacetone kinase subunit DhaK n=1 Tax=Tessaracoccus sp. SD287 TaxID=2782008 RepID=UPI001A966D9F|nr:dihydroxyacetone kinase subunit DhaK [Tessaracoccus sp. SD287]MBO1030806.1 dihydroxyacetone kinase subunit DhaK [Tessaracoccus sp. SD287]
MNAPEDLVDETLDGLVAISRGLLARDPGSRVVRSTRIEQGKVGLVVGGGSGHEPMYGAFVGPGLANASVSGNIFAAPAPQHVQEAIEAADAGAGVLVVYGNYAGDILNFDLGAEDAADNGVVSKTVLVRDDVATEDREGRRGIGGAFYVVKAAGAACAKGLSLEEAAAVTERVEFNTRTIGIALRAGVLPDTGKRTFELGDDEIEIGLGVHGEVGVERTKLVPADEIAEKMLNRILVDLPFESGDRVAVLLNNLGATTQMELLIVYRRLAQLLEEKGITVERTDIGAPFTSQDMAGFSLTLLKLTDEIVELLDAPCESVPFTQA